MTACSLAGSNLGLSKTMNGSSYLNKKIDIRYLSIPDFTIDLSIARPVDSYHFRDFRPHLFLIGQYLYKNVH